MRSLTAYKRGRVPYAEAQALQERLVDLRKEGAIDDTLLLLEHPKVITLGRAAKRVNVLLSEEALKAREAGFGGAKIKVGRPHVAEDVAREQMAADPKVAAEFAQRLASDPAFAKDPQARLAFFAKRHSSYDERLNLYPVLRTDTAL